MLMSMTRLYRAGIDEGYEDVRVMGDALRPSAREAREARAKDAVMLRARTRAMRPFWG